MAHVLKLIDAFESTTLDLQSAATTGYYLVQYVPGFAQQQIAYNGSQYTDGNVPVSGRAANIVETIVVDIVGSSVDDALAKLRALERFVINARALVAPDNGNINVGNYIQYKPQNSTKTMRAYVVGGSVQTPDSLLDAVINVSMIQGVTITLEREPFWRDDAGIIALKDPVVTTVSTDWFKFTGLTAVKGDMPGLVLASAETQSAAARTKLWIGIASERRYGSSYSSGGIVEAEAGTLYNGSATAVDATASPGAGASRVRTSFATLATTGRRVTFTGPTGGWRVFARMKLSGAGTATVSIKYGDAASSGVLVANAAVAVTATAWTMYDMGVLTTPLSYNHRLSASGTYVELWANGTAGTDVDIDFLFYLPVEFSLAVSGALLTTSNLYPAAPPNGPQFAFFNNGVMSRVQCGSWYNDATGGTYYYANAIAAYRGELRAPPGNIAYYGIMTDASNANLLAPGTWNVGLFYAPLYAVAGGAG